MSDDLYFDDLRELMQKIENACDKGIGKFAAMSTEVVSEAELRVRLESIRNCLVTRDGARQILADFMAGTTVIHAPETPDDNQPDEPIIPLDSMSVMHALETLRWTIIGFSDAYDDDDDDVDE